MQAAAEFGFGPNEGAVPSFDGVMRLAFAVDGRSGYAGAVMRQPSSDGPVAVELELADGAQSETALAQLARIVSLDYDGQGFLEVGARDPLIGELQRRHPGQRPVLFHSPYEAATWSIISARRPARAAAAVRQALGERFGHTFELAGQALHAFPAPQRLVEALPDGFPGLNAQKIERLRAIALAALDGVLDVARLHELGPERATEALQALSGIGPFYAGLIVLRGSGFADAPLLVAERRVLEHAARFYGDPDLGFERFAEIAERWRPFRTWCTVLIRLAGDRAG